MKKQLKKELNFLLLGSYGQTNLGDDILMFNYLSFLREFNPNNIYVNVNEISLVPSIINKQFKNIHYLKTYKLSISDWIQIIKKVDVIFYGGGTIFKELYKTTGRSKYSVISRIMLFNLICFLLKKKVFNLHIGIGVLNTKIGRLITKLSLLFSTHTIFRDNDSYNFALNKLNLNKKQIEGATDGLFINKYWQKVDQLKNLNIDKKKYNQIIGVNILHDIPDWIDKDSYKKEISKIVNDLIGKNNFIILLPFQVGFNKNNDLVFIKKEIIPFIENKKSFKVLEDYSLEEVNAIYQQFDLFIGMRFHSLLLATVNQIPYLAIEYDTKCTRYLQEINYKYTIKLDNLEKERLIKILEGLNKNRKEIKLNLLKYSDQFFHKGNLWQKSINF